MLLYSTKKLIDVCDIRPSKNEAKKKLKEDDLVSFVPMENLGVLCKDLNLAKEKALKDVIGNYTYFADGDLLLAKITPCFENGKIGIAKNLKNGIGFGSSEFLVFRSKGEIDSEYLFYFFLREDFRSEGKKMMTGAVGHKRVSKEFIEDLKIPLPSIDEQKRIVKILDEVFDSVAKVKEATENNLKNAREVFESYLQSVFENSKYEEKRIDEVAKVVNGFSFDSKDFSPKNKVKSVKITNVGVGNFIEEENNFLPESYFDIYFDYQAHEGDIAIALTRTIISDGLKVAIVPKSYDRSLLNQRVAAIRTSKDQISQSFLYNFLRTKKVADYVKSNVNTLMQPNLSINDLKKLGSRQL